MKATVIIPTFGQRQDYLWDTIECIQKQSFPGPMYEILVIDNSPDAAAQNIVNRANQTGKHVVRYIREHNSGLHYARHAGANASLGEIIIYVDDDVRMEKHWLKFILEPFTDKQVGACGGKIEVTFDGEAPEWISQINLGIYAQLNYGKQKKYLKSPQDIYGCNMAVRKTVLFEVGGFNPDGIGNKKNIWFRGDGECGLNAKIYKAGYKIAYTPEAWIQHRISADRITPRSYYWKYFINGIQDSFIRIRRIYHQKFWRINTFLYLNYCFLKFGFIYVRSILTKNRKHNQRALAWYWYGKGQHAIRVLSNKKLRNHVVKDSFI